MSAGPDHWLYGTDEPVPEPIDLRWGAASVTLRGTRLGPLCVDGHEVWHGIDFLYRDTDWGTPVRRIESQSHTATEGGFRIELSGHVEVNPRLAFRITIEAGEAELTYEVHATAQGALATNRTGLVLMHPLSACGRSVEVEHIDGRSSRSTFPHLIAPWPPFMLVRALRHEYADGAWANSRFTGESFELEDQRNNADASFKTYSRSNLMPRPFMLHAGSPVRQGVQLRIESTPPRARPVSSPVQVQVQMTDGAPALPMPVLGLAIAPHDTGAQGPELQALRELAPPRLHLVLSATDPDLDAPALARLLAHAGRPTLRLDVTGLDEARAGPHLARIAGLLRDAGVTAAEVAAFPSTPAVVEAARVAFPAARVGGGTPYFFTQLNRIEDLAPIDFLCFTTASVVHGADDEEIMAGLQSLPAMIDTLRANQGGVHVQVGPSAIGARHSPLGGQPVTDGKRRIALARRDPRTRGLFGAAWVLGYVERFATAGAQALTLLDLQADAAVVEDSHTTPAFEALRHLMRARRYRPVSRDRPSALAAMVLENGADREILLGNLCPLPLALEVHGLPADAPGWLMDATSLAGHAAHTTGRWREVALRGGELTLPPYAIARF